LKIDSCLSENAGIPVQMSFGKENLGEGKETVVLSELDEASK